MTKPLFCLLLLVFSVNSTRGQARDTLYKLYKAKQFPQLDRLNSDKGHSLYLFYKAVYANVCNRPAASNSELDRWMKGKEQPPSPTAFEYWTLRTDNYIKLFDYKNAALIQRKLLNEFRDQYDSSEYKGEQYAVKIWESLRNERPQTIEQPPVSRIPLTRDIAGLLNIKVKAPGSSDTNFVFDTGAGMSSITESLALKLKFKFMPDTGIYVAGASNIYNPVRIALAEELRIGAIIIRNEPFLVFKDEALTFAGGAYKINGIIGFPVAKGLGSITITPAHLVIAGAARIDTLAEKNLFVEQLRPVLFLTYKGKSLPFNFDTGASATSFSKTFFDAYGAELKQTGLIEKDRYASAGGAKETSVLKLKTIALALGNQEIQFRDLKIDTENYHVSGNRLYGNIGQDLLKQYREVTISFTGNYLKLVK